MGQPMSVKVDAKLQWQDSGIPVSNGQNVVVWAKGLWAYGSPTTISDKWLGPEGRPQGGATAGFLMPGATYNTLICKIGSLGSPKAIGAAIQFTISESGNMFFAMNDNSFTDNDGYVVAFVYTNVPAITVSTSVQNVPSMPPNFELSQNYPNPFNPSTSISFDLPSQENVEITVFDLNGKRIQGMILGTLEAGSHSQSWNGLDEYGNAVSSGTYFYQVKAGEAVQAKKMLLLK